MLFYFVKHNTAYEMRISDWSSDVCSSDRLTGSHGGVVDADFPSDAIVFARAMGAAELLDYPRERLRGLVLEDGAITSHVVIVARAMGIASGRAACRERVCKYV